MESAGYSGTPLIKKLGIKPVSRLVLINPPAHLVEPEGPIPAGGAHDEADLILFFTVSRDEVRRSLPALMDRLDPDGVLWMSWPKKSSRVPTDIVEQDLRDLLLPTGLVDNKVCAIDDVWSGLRLVVRKELRP